MINSEIKKNAGKKFIFLNVTGIQNLYLSKRTFTNSIITRKLKSKNFIKSKLFQSLK